MLTVVILEGKVYTVLVVGLDVLSVVTVVVSTVVGLVRMVGFDVLSVVTVVVFNVEGVVRMVGLDVLSVVVVTSGVVFAAAVKVTGRVLLVNLCTLREDTDGKVYLVIRVGGLYCLAVGGGGTDGVGLRVVEAVVRERCIAGHLATSA